MSIVHVVKTEQKPLKCELYYCLFSYFNSVKDLIHQFDSRVFVGHLFHLYTHTYNRHAIRHTHYIHQIRLFSQKTWREGRRQRQKLRVGIQVIRFNSGGKILSGDFPLQKYPFLPFFLIPDISCFWRLWLR